MKSSGKTAAPVKTCNSARLQKKTEKQAEHLGATPEPQKEEEKQSRGIVRGLKRPASDASDSSLSAGDISDLDTQTPDRPIDRLPASPRVDRGNSLSSDATTEKLIFTDQPPPAKRTKHEPEGQKPARQDKLEVPGSRARRRTAKGQAYMDSGLEDEIQQEAPKKAKGSASKVKNTQRIRAEKRKEREEEARINFWRFWPWIPELKEGYKYQMRMHLFKAARIGADPTEEEMAAVPGLLSLSPEQDLGADEAGEASRAKETEHAEEARQQPSEWPNQQPGSGRQSVCKRKLATARAGLPAGGRKLSEPPSSSSRRAATDLHSPTAELARPEDSTPSEAEQEPWMSAWKPSHLERLRRIEEEAEAARHEPILLPGTQEYWVEEIPEPDPKEAAKKPVKPSRKGKGKGSRHVKRPKTLKKKNKRN